MKSLGLRQQIALVVFISITFATLIISITLYTFNQKRAFTDAVHSSEEMVQAAALSFSQAVAADDEVLLDALLHELQSRKHLYITEAYVVMHDGLIKAHSVPEEYGKKYPSPPLLTGREPSRLSEVTAITGESFSVVSLLQYRGHSLGALVVTFSTSHIFQKALNELFWIIGVTIFVLIIAGLGVFVYGRMIVKRVDALKEKAIGIGRGEWGEPIAVEGSDEISHLTEAFNRMGKDLAELRRKDLKSAERITQLNRELTTQLSRIKGLKEQLAEENTALRSELTLLHKPGEIIGSNGALRQLILQAQQIASLPVTVLITGESGTGKELVARYLHEGGVRSSGRFVTVNCAALPTSLIENELFGHEKGAFTGASSTRRGKFEEADGGTIFLDEIGEIPLEAQSKLLRILQTGELSRVGGSAHISVDVRVIAATNKDLQEEVKLKHFREDLYYRLKVVELTCPPLRERRDDIPALAQHFIDHYSRKLDREVVGISPSALTLLSSYRWPGNIRELENMTARAVALARSKVLGADDFTINQEECAPLQESTRGTETDEFDRLIALCGLSKEELSDEGWEKIIQRCEKICLQTVLNRNRNQKEAATTLGLTQSKLHRLKKKLHIEKSANTNAAESGESISKSK
ncbi:MAG: sigma 54-interacting transcriptional regulator [Thermodesulfobacteriota bacterium]